MSDRSAEALPPPSGCNAMATPPAGHVCRHYLEGRCSWGAQCRMLHPSTTTESVAVAASPSSPPRQARRCSENVLTIPESLTPVCYYTYTSQPCLLGKQCCRSHHVPSAEAVNRDIHSREAQGLCPYWLSGEVCILGPTCPYSHGLSQSLLHERLPLPMAKSECVELWQSKMLIVRMVMLRAAFTGLCEFVLSSGQLVAVQFAASCALLPIPLRRAMSPHQLREELEGCTQHGVLWLCGEPELLWNALRLYLTQSTCGVGIWDGKFARASRNDYDCLFGPISECLLAQKNQCPCVHEAEYWRASNAAFTSPDRLG